MDDDGGLGIRNWGYYDPHPPIKGNLGLQLMSASTERDAKPLLSTNSPSFFLHRVHEPAHTPIPSHQIPMDFARAGMWAHRQNSSNNKLLHVNSIPSHHTHHQTNFSLITENTLHALPQQSTPFLPQPEPIKNDQITPTVQDANILNPSNPPPLKKRAQAHEPKTPKPKKPKKVVEPTNGTTPRGAKQGTRKDTGVVINGIDLDLSRIPTPICSCTGIHQQCYRWGIGGWQSACCTTSISIYPLPMSEKRRGARIAGRKMSQGAFKKVLEKLAGEGYNLSNPIDLRGFWAKHGTNKFVTIK